MSNLLLFANNASTVFASPVAPGDLTVQVAAGKGALFPSPSAGQACLVTFTDVATQQTIEIALCTARSGDVLTVTRAQEGTSASAFDPGDLIEMRPTAGTMGSFVQQLQAQQQAGNYALDSGIANAMVITLSPVPSSMTALIGTPIRVSVVHNSTLTTVTLDVNGLGPHNVLNPDGSLPGAGVFKAGGVYTLVWDGAEFQLQGGIITGTQSGSGATASGFTRLSNGMIIQWGKFTGSNGDAVNLPIPFTTVYTLAMDIGTGGGSEQNLVNTNTTDLQHFTIYLWNWNGSGWTAATGKGIGWVAVGY